ncbi:hypothetical protein N657DRAFT_586499 [Parathielavia appendiculata]|uniref:Uncharacterized protein n=1 Tax=Parathielavia appendiculata TaxID=2587402 RepID=A0AAN6U9H8_9PEZI|nr:hypothetical protein N657DRAFT_586499 [Parathielavia appendiculata]
MAPAANTARQRRIPGSARSPAESDSDAEYQAYNGRLKEAGAARTRLRKAKQTRDKNRAALVTAFEVALRQIESRIQKSVAKHKDLRSAMHIAHLRRLKQAMDRRDEKIDKIARKLAEHQQRMLNLAVQLQALYEGRKEDVASVLKEGGGQKKTGIDEVWLQMNHGHRHPLREGAVVAGGVGGVGSGEGSALG